MGWFSGAEKEPGYVDRVWKTEEECYKGLAKAILVAMKENRLPVIISFFPIDRQRVEKFLADLQVPLVVVTDDMHAISRTALVAYSFSGRDILRLRSMQSLLQKEALNQPGLAVFFTTHHTDKSAEQELLKVLTGNRDSPVNPVFCLHLESPLLQQFGAKNILDMMEKLGMKDDDFVEHSLVTSAINRARQKIAKQVLVGKNADSEKEWFDKNVGPGQPN
ncbi:MAG: hypothetical protein JST46_13035 [Bacteroidetes bacterium]|nr:hypothetical protein [Bacteroidota bacterium]